MYQLPGKRIALAFSDPAGANACRAIADIYRLEHRELPLLFSNRNHFAGTVANFQLIEQAPDWKALGIDCLFTGTSHPESSQYFEVNCIRTAREGGVYTISFVDHWVNFRLRFTGREGIEYPDEIWVVDEAARLLAIAEGLPVERIRVSGNPYHYFLQHYWKSAFSDKKYLQQFNIPGQGMHLLYAPDPLSIRNGKEVAGFTEAEALKDILEAIASQPGNIQLIIKAHPLQPTEVLQSMLQQYEGIGSYLVQQADVPELIHASDVVVGFYSNMLLDAVALGRKVIRYFPGNPGADLLRHSLLVPPAIASKDILKTQVNQMI